MSMRLSRSIVGEAEAEAVHRVICEDGYLGIGKEVQQFEADVAAYLGVPASWVISVNTGQPPCIWLSRPCSGTGAARKCWCLR